MTGFVLQNKIGEAGLMLTALNGVINPIQGVPQKQGNETSISSSCQMIAYHMIMTLMKLRAKYFIAVFVKSNKPLSSFTLSSSPHPLLHT